jgi:hypothetical protein
MEPTSKPIRKPDYRLELVDDETMLYNPADTKIISFNQTAALIWHLCDGQISMEEMISALQEAYPDSRDEIAEDVRATLEQFEKIGCIDPA